MKCLYIYNPVSGKGVAEKKKKYIVKSLIEKFGEVDVFATREQGELKKKAKESCGVYDVLVFAGGDGSFNEVISGLGEHENRPTIGYIPTGTVNDIARSVKIPRRIKGAVKNLITGTACSMDVMRVNDGYAMYVVCSGGLTSCSYTAKQSRKKRFGKIAYVIEALKNCFKFDEYCVRLEAEDATESGTAVMVMIMNGKSVASMQVNSGACLDDGKVEVVIVHEKPKNKESAFFRRFRYLLSVLRVFIYGYKSLPEFNNVSTYRLSEFTIDVSDDIIWNFDGEKGVCGKLYVKVLKKHIKLIIPS